MSIHAFPIAHQNRIVRMPIQTTIQTDPPVRPSLSRMVSLHFPSTWTLRFRGNLALHYRTRIRPNSASRQGTLDYGGSWHVPCFSPTSLVHPASTGSLRLSRSDRSGLRGGPERVPDLRRKVTSRGPGSPPGLGETHATHSETRSWQTRSMKRREGDESKRPRSAWKGPGHPWLESHYGSLNPLLHG